MSTINRSGLPSLLRRCLETTNIIDNGHSAARDRMSRVKNWQTGVVAVRWMAAAIRSRPRGTSTSPGSDVLWTKPSEPCFYPALGIPLLMSVPLGAHEGARSRPGTWAGLETLITLIEMSDQPRARVVWEGRSREAPPYPDLCAK
jgi:hypothetical protein